MIYIEFVDYNTYLHSFTLVETIQGAKNLGVSIKMLTGDQDVIAKETARSLGMGLNIYNAKVLRKEFYDSKPVAQLIENADGFGEVLPQDKYTVVQCLKTMGHVVGMTGDGVNDAPALKVADVGIAVAGSSEAARSAADIVLLDEGLASILKAITVSR